MIKLLGIVLIAVGFALRWNALLVVVMAGIATGFLAGFSWQEIVQMTGRFFVDNRALVLPTILLVPIVGLLEKHGLQQHVATLMRRARAATAGRVLWLYQCVRGVSSMMGMSIGNHASMVRPLVAPMAEAANALRTEPADGRAAENTTEPHRDANGSAREEIRAHAAAAENVGNFFSDDIFVAVAALLLVKGVLESAGVPVSLREVQWWSAPTAVWVLVVGWWRYRVLDRRLVQTNGAGTGATDAAAAGEERP